VFVLGVDPGLSRCGYGVLASEPWLRVVAAGVITTAPARSIEHRLGELHAELGALVDELRPDVMVVERVFFQVNARTAMSVGQASGLALASASASGCVVAQYTANEVKQAVVGYGSATKEQVQRMVASILALDAPPRPPDVADALALAVCHLTAQPLRRAVEAAGPRSPAAASDRRPAAAGRLGGGR